jgi:hypothetical protein
MPTNPRNVPGPLQQLWERLLGQWVAPVPAEIAVCEFDCRKNQCLHGEWASCERRVSKAAGELMPDSNVDPGRKV